jgi:hypothetical protein
MWHLLNVIFEILGALVVVLFQRPSSIHMSFLLRVLAHSSLPQCNYLNTKTSKRAIKPLNLERLRKEAIEHRKNNYTERHRKGERLSPHDGCPILGPRSRSGCLLSTSLSLRLAGTSRVDRVDLYGLNRNGIGPSSS